MQCAHVLELWGPVLSELCDGNIVESEFCIVPVLFVIFVFILFRFSLGIIIFGEAFER